MQVKDDTRSSRKWASCMPARNVIIIIISSSSSHSVYPKRISTCRLLRDTRTKDGRFAVWRRGKGTEDFWKTGTNKGYVWGGGERGLYQMRQQKTSEMIGKLLTFRNVVLLAAAAKCQYSYADFKIQLRCVSSRKNARGRAPNEVSKRCIRNVTQEI